RRGVRENSEFSRTMSSRSQVSGDDSKVERNNDKTPIGDGPGTRGKTGIGHGWYPRHRGGDRGSAAGRRGRGNDHGEVLDERYPNGTPVSSRQTCGPVPAWKCLPPPRVSSSARSTSWSTTQAGREVCWVDRGNVSVVSWQRLRPGE